MNNIDRIIAYVVAGIMVVTLFTGVRNSTPQATEISPMDNLVQLAMLQMITESKKDISPALAGVYSQVEQKFYQGIKAGTSDQFVVDSSGNITATSLTSSGAISGTTITGTGATTGTSAIFSGAVTSDSPTFVVDATNNKVGMGTTSPTALLTVGSTTPSSLTAANQYKSGYINGEFEVDGASWFDGLMTLAAGLGVTGDTTLASTTATTFKVGQEGTGATRINHGVCNIHAASNTIAATTTTQVDCQSGTGTQTAISDMPAWAAGDATFLSMATTTSTVFEGLSILGVNASTTAGYITLDLYNGTGDTFTWSATASTSWQYLNIR